MQNSRPLFIYPYIDQSDFNLTNLSLLNIQYSLHFVRIHKVAGLWIVSSFSICYYCYCRPTTIEL